MSIIYVGVEHNNLQEEVERLMKMYEKHSIKTKKWLLIGLGRHGKDTAAEYLRDKHNYIFTSSSMYAAEKFVYNSLKDVLGYGSFEQCYEDRHNWRELWYQLIKAYNSKQGSRIASEMIADGYDMYVGMRDDGELTQCKKECLFDIIVWIDAEERLGVTESKESCKVTKEDAHVIIYNNTTLEDLYSQLDALVTVVESWED